ncbi:Thioredoxin-related protein [Lutimaribacter pacificus]|uniref:Thioredoxin-related protein n=1 Tax=Lutimaribacter pacificus TaxID=391948 RepID=A0A1H0JQC7_9RHOB|nr:thioredoxin family protein [Lutimaribacter pacificus]SDO45956.1 Thioredoxin-related protein [Lutimaribacter pacificus]SHK07503.1 Thioredoxin-related protein [Lutimaribacter pacificus]
MKKLIAGFWAVLFALPVMAAPVGDDGLHKEPWMRDTFKDLQEDLAEANAEGKRLVLMVEQRGCIYCKKMHEEIYPREEISSYIGENFFVVQINLHGDTEMVDTDGEALSEKAAARKWGILFTPTVIFLPEEVPQDVSVRDAAVAIMPGAFGEQTTYDMFVWVNEKLYELDNDEDFQRYHARKIQERQQKSND